jgi:predicted PurR-regulated permease PerM
MELEKNHMNFRVETGTLVKIITVGVIFWLAFLLRDVVFVILMAVVLASSIEPATRWFISHRIPRIVSVLTIYFSLVLLFVGMFYFLLIPLLGDLQGFLSALPNYFGSFGDSYLSGSLSSVGGLINNIPISDIVTQANNTIAGLSKNALSTATAILGGVLSLVLTIVLSFYLSVQQDGITNFLKTVTPTKHRKYVIGLWNRAEKKIGLWMQGQLLLGVIVAVLVYLGLTLLGVKHALLLGFLAGIFELIPLFGPILSAIPGIAIAFVDSGFTLAVVVMGLYLIIQQFESQLIYPLVVKKVVGVPPIISIVALVVGAKLAGFIGLLLSVPVAAILMEFFNDLEKDRIMEEGGGK